MAKIMLVEDDNNLREIYEARLLAEGYEIVSAKDGEEALAMAVKERPDLIISDVMMPKISGFDMLDILRSTPETKNTKVIMMTALSQAEDKTRADKLGADRYLVKSQVTLEDVAKVARDVLTGDDGPVPAAVSDNTAAPAPADPAAVAPAAPVATVDPQPVVPPPAAAPDPITAAPIPAPIDPALAPTEPPVNEAPVEPPKVEAAPAAAQPAASPEDPGEKAARLTEAVHQALGDLSTPAGTEPSTASAADSPSQKKRIIQPVNPIDAKPDLNDLLKKEEAREAASQVMTQVAESASATVTASQSDPATTFPPQQIPVTPVAEASMTQPELTPIDIPEPAQAPLASTELPPAAEATPIVLPALPEPIKEDVPVPVIDPKESEGAQTVQAETAAVEQQINSFVAEAPSDTQISAPLELPVEAPLTPAAIQPSPAPVAAPVQPPATVAVPAPEAPKPAAPAAPATTAVATGPLDPNDPNSIAL